MCSGIRRSPLWPAIPTQGPVASHPRNLTDDMIRALAERGGVMGINYCTAFLRDFRGEEQVSRISDMVEHMKHIRKIGRHRCIGLGSDFDGISGNLEMRDAPGAHAGACHGKGRLYSSEIEAVFCKMCCGFTGKSCTGKKFYKILHSHEADFTSVWYAVYIGVCRDRR